MTDRRVDIGSRIVAGRVLGEVAPQQRSRVARHLLDIAADPIPEHLWRGIVAGALAQLGSAYQEDVVRLSRSLLKDWTESASGRMTGARELAGLGPAFREEAAAAFERIVADVSADPSTRMDAYARLAKLGEPHRSPAVRALRACLENDRDLAARCDAAEQLVNIGPEFHPLVVSQLLGIAKARAAPDVRARAWQTVAQLREDLRSRGARARFDLVVGGKLNPQFTNGFAQRISPADVHDIPELSAWLIYALGDTSRSAHERLSAARSLVTLGRQFHRKAVDGVLALIGSGDVPWTATRWLSSGFTDLGMGLRREIARALYRLIGAAHTPAAAVVSVATMVERLGCRAEPELIVALQRLVDDRSADSDVRVEAALSLARLVPEMLEHAVATTAAQFEYVDAPYRWARSMRELASFGGDVISHLRAGLARADLPRRHREEAARLLVLLADRRVRVFRGT